MINVAYYNVCNVAFASLIYMGLVTLVGVSHSRSLCLQFCKISANGLEIFHFECVT